MNAPWLEILKELSNLLGMPIEVDPALKFGKSRVEMSSRHGRRPVLDVLESGPYQNSASLIVEKDRLRLVPAAEATRFWADWLKEHK